MNARNWIAFFLLLLPAAFAAEPPNPLAASGVITRTLENGLTVVVSEDPAAPLAVADLWVAAGSVDDGGTGAAHALEHMVFRGGKGVPSGRVDAAVEAAGGTMYATTFPDATHYWTAIPAARLGDALGALADAMREPAVVRDAWERERRVMLEEIARDAGNLVADVRRALAGRLYGQPHGVPVMGTPGILAKLEPEAIRDFHKAHYRPDRMTLVVAGPVDPDEIFGQAEKALGALPKPAGKPPERTAPAASQAQAEVEADDGSTVVVGFAWPAPKADDAVLDVLATVLRRRLEAALGERARRVEAAHPWQRAGMVLVLAEGAERDRAVIREGMRHVLAAAPGSVGEAEVASAVRQRKWAWWMEHEKPAAQARTLGLAATLGEVSEATGAHDRLGKVTLDAVREAVGTMLKDPPLPVAGGLL